MKNVRKDLSTSLQSLRKIAEDFELLRNDLSTDQLTSLQQAIEEIRCQLEEAISHVERYKVVFMIGKELGGGRFGEFTHGPVPDIDQMLEVTPDEEGDVIIRMSVDPEGESVYVTLYGYLEGEWVPNPDKEAEGKIPNAKATSA